jgi:nitrate/TMAO reductase-like tetraheme cytochrome c subunit
MSVSPRSHIYRLVVLLVVIAAGFAAVRSLAIPDSWDNEKFYRVDALEDLTLQPLRMGGNEACAGSGCHEEQRVAKHKERFNALAKGNHSGLACENCHGSLSEHISDDSRVASALINRDNTLCLSCHAPLLSRPKGFPQFNAENTGHWYFDVEITTPCRDCHDPHEPRHMAAPRNRSELEEESETAAADQPHAVSEVTQ